MSAPDLLKVVMPIGILIALLGIRWMNKEIAGLVEENRRERTREDCGEETS